jgi:purine-binding chemotaxis protein CheW
MTEEKKSIQVVEFILGDDHFAIDIFNVREVVENTKLTKVPNMRPEVVGIMDLRGEITTIVDLKKWLNIEEKRTGDLSCRVIVLDEKATNSKTGIRVDDVLSVSTFENEEVDTTSLASFDHEGGVIVGVIKKKVKVKDKETHELIVLIDIKKLLNS